MTRFWTGFYTFEVGRRYDNYLVEAIRFLVADKPKRFLIRRELPGLVNQELATYRRENRVAE